MIDLILTSASSSSSSPPPPPTTTTKSGNDQTYRHGVLNYPNHWQGGFIALRNFCVPNGTRVVTPEITRLRDGKVLRKSEVLVAGVTSLTNVEINKVKRIILVNIFSCLLTFYYFKIHSDPKFIIFTHLIGLIIAYLFHSLLFHFGKKGLEKHIHTISPVPHELKLADIQNASSASQPSQEHRYWLMKYNIKKVNYDLLIQFKIQKNYQKYWSLVVYDIYGIPIQQFVNLENIIWVKNDKNDNNNHDNNNNHENHNENQDYFISIRLSRFPPKYTEASVVLSDKTIQDDIQLISSKSPNIIFGHSTIDISTTSIDYVIFRIVHPTTNKVIEYSQPTVKLARPSLDSAIPKDIQGGYFVDVVM